MRSRPSRRACFGPAVVFQRAPASAAAAMVVTEMKTPIRLFALACSRPSRSFSSPIAVNERQFYSVSTVVLHYQ
jgi:hypothetical protein